MQCVNCRNDFNFGAVVCPYCHGNPYVFGSSPYQETVPSTGGILGWLFGPRKRKLAADQTEYTVVDWNVIPPRKMKKCKNCNNLSIMERPYCQTCKKKFVDPE